MLTAALPIIELRGAIPVGMSLGMFPAHATIITFIGSMIPAPFILFTIRPIFNYLKKTKLFNKVVHKLTNKSLNKSGNIQKYGAWGLFVNIRCHPSFRYWCMEWKFSSGTFGHAF